MFYCQTLSFNSIELQYISSVYTVLCHILPNTCQHSQYWSKTSFYHSDSSILRSLAGGVRYLSNKHSPSVQIPQLIRYQSNLTEMSPISISMQILDKRFGEEMLKLDQRETRLFII